MIGIVEANFFRWNGEWIIKEIALYLEETDDYHVWIFKAPCPFKDLSNDDKRRCKWLSRNICDLRWDEGDHSFETQSEIAAIIRNKATSFITKGLEKSKVLSRFLKIDVTNAENLGCPRLSTITVPTPKSCTFHRDDNNCTLVKAFRLTTWLRRRECTSI